MNQRTVLLVAVGVIAAPLAAHSDKVKPVHEYGPAPSWSEYRRIAEAAVRERLVDPESARFTWLSGMATGEYRAELFQPKVAGYWACGRVNAKNRMGGYSGGGTFMVAVDDGRVLAISLDTSPNGVAGSADIGCRSLISRGVLPPVPAETASRADGPDAPSPSGSITNTEPAVAPHANAAGFAVRAMPEGAYIGAVISGSPAKFAGLKPGMVITSVNAIPLAGMGEAMRKVVDAAGTAATLTLIGGTTIKLGGSK